MIHVSTIQPLHSTHDLNHNDIWISEASNRVMRYSMHDMHWTQRSHAGVKKPYALNVNNRGFNFSKSDMLEICEKYTVKSFILTLNDAEFAKFLLKYA